MTDTGTSTNAEAWAHRVDAWRASGERAEEYSKRGGYAASTLRWWASKLKRELPATAPAVPLARVIRTAAAAPAPSLAATAMPIVIEAVTTGARVLIAPGADRATLAMVLEVLGLAAAR